MNSTFGSTGKTNISSSGNKLSYSTNRAIFTMGIALAVFAQSLFASGTIRGKVFDNTTEEALPAANVTVEGTNIGAAADLNGEYFIPNAPSGTQTLVITYIGYVTQSVDVTIPEGGMVTEDFGLLPDVVEGQEVTVMAQGKGQMQAINQQLASDKISSVVSEARIQELPDFNAAQALSRLPGISTLESSGEANKVVIRGLAPQYNTVAVEGVKLASTGSTQMGVVALNWITSGNIDNDRSVDLSMVSPYMIKTISVYKSLTSDMNANSLGGTVNMELREAPTELHYDVLWQSGYTAKTGNYGNYRAVGSASQRFMDDKVGVYLLANIEQYDRDADNMSARYGIASSEIDPLTRYRPIRVQDVTLNRHLETRNRYGGNLILDYRLPSGSLKAVNMFTRLSSDYTEHQTVLGYTGNTLDFRVRQGVRTTDLTMNSLNFHYDLSRMAVDLKYAQTTSRNDQPESPYSRFRQTDLGISGGVPLDTPPDSLSKNVIYRGPTESTISSISLFSSLYTEKRRSLSADVKFPIGLGLNLVGYIRIGGQYHGQWNTNDQESPYANINTGSDIQDLIADAIAERFSIEYDDKGKFPASQFMGDSSLWTESFLDDRFGTFYWAANPDILAGIAHMLDGDTTYIGRVEGPENTGGWYNGLFQQLANDYEYEEHYSAGYVMSELSLPRVKVVSGVRYEKVAMKYTAYNMVDNRSPEGQLYATAVAEPVNDFLLPSVQMKYSPFRWMDVRYSYTETLARPDYHQLSPKYTMSNDRLNVWAGNPDLKPAHSFNNDLMLSIYSNKLGLLSIGAFAKTIRDFTYSTRYQLFPRDSLTTGLRPITSFSPWQPNPAAWLNTYMNTPYDAKVKGIEIDFQTRFWYLPLGLDGVVFGINYTKIESDATYPLRQVKTLYPPFPQLPITFTIDSTRSGRLIHQPDDILNTYIGYERGGFSARVSFLFQGNAVSYVGAFPEQDGYTRDYFRIDASARQKLPFAGAEIYLDCTNLNSATNASAQRSIDGFTNEKYYGLTANLGIRFKL